MVILALFGILNGYVTARYLRFFGNSDLKLAATISGLVLPAFILGVFFVELFFAYVQKSALRYSFATTIARVIGWYLFNASTCYIGAYQGYVKNIDAVPSEVNKVLRPIPAQPYYLSIFVIAPVFGFIQFVSLYVEFSYLIDSVFKASWYAMFGFLLLNVLMLVITIILLSIVATYMQLCH